MKASVIRFHDLIGEPDWNVTFISLCICQSEVGKAALYLMHFLVEFAVLGFAPLPVEGSAPLRSSRNARILVLLGCALIYCNS